MDSWLTRPSSHEALAVRHDANHGRYEVERTLFSEAYRDHVYLQLCGFFMTAVVLHHLSLLPTCHLYLQQDNNER
jgi:hypothetical protein